MAYCDRSDIEAVFGTVDVRRWADRNNDGNLADIEAAVTAAIAIADGLIDERLRGGAYAIPFDGTPPFTIIDLSRKLAACELYASRGIQDTNAEGEAIDRLSGYRRDAYKRLAGIRAGQIVLDADDLCERAPVLVDLTLHRDEEMV